MTTSRRDDELAERVADLEDTLTELRDEIRRPPRGPLGLPRPPTPRELIEFADDFAIPAAIAALEANIRALEVLQQALRLADPARTAREESRGARRRAEQVGRVTLEQVDRALDDLAEAIEGGGLPSDPEARSIIEEARGLSAEIEERIGESERARPDSRLSADEPEDAIEIDVESELRSIKDELGEGSDDDTLDDDVP